MTTQAKLRESDLCSHTGILCLLYSSEGLLLADADGKLRRVSLILWVRGRVKQKGRNGVWPAAAECGQMGVC